MIHSPLQQTSAKIKKKEAPKQHPALEPLFSPSLGGGDIFNVDFHSIFYSFT